MFCSLSRRAGAETVREVSLKFYFPDFVRQLPIQCGYHRVEHLFSIGGGLLLVIQFRF